MSESVVPERSRRRLLVVVAVLLAVVLAAAAVVWMGRDGGGPAVPVAASSSSPEVPTPTATSTGPGGDGGDGVDPSPARSSAPSSDDPDGPDGTADAADPADPTDGASTDGGTGGDATTYTQDELPPVAPDATAEGADGVTARLGKVEHVTGEAVAAGEVSGPAVRLTVRVTNDADEPLDLSFVAVNAYVGPDRAPASTFVRPGAKPFDGVLEPGESGRGVVLFAMTEEESRDVMVTVDYGADVPALAFEGSFEG